MTVFEMAKKYYPKYWSLARLETLKDAGKLTEEEVAEITDSIKEGEE